MIRVRKFSLPDLRDGYVIAGSSLGAFFGGPLGPREVVNGVDQKDMREGLREISQLALAARIVFLREQTNVVAQRQQPIEDLVRLIVAAQHREVIDQPKGARQKCPL